MPATLVICWWGQRLTLVGPDGRVVEAATGPDPAATLVRLVEAEFPPGASVRLLYQPDSMVLHEAACPPGGRSRLRRLFAADFPAIRSTATVWGTAPLRTTRDGPATVLYLEPESPLPRLGTRLAARGRRLDGAWPLPALWDHERVPAMNARGFLGVAAMNDHVLVYFVAPTGERTIRFFGGPPALGRAVGEIRHALNRCDEAEPPSTVLVAEPGPAAASLGESLSTAAPSLANPSAWLAEVAQLDPSSSDNLLAPGRPILGGVRQRQAVAASGIILLAGALGGLIQGHRERNHAARILVAQAEAATAAQRTVQAGESLKQRIDTLEGAWTAAQAPASPHYAFLVALARAAAPTVVLHSVRIAGSEFEISGRTDPEPGHAAEAVLRFRQAFFTPGGPWRVEPAAAGPPLPGGNFVLRGTWSPLTPEEP